MVNFTEKALKRLVEIRPHKEYILQVRVVGGGCSGLSYKMDFINVPPEDTYMGEIGEGNTVLIVSVDKKSALHLEGTVVDWEDGLNGAGWVYNNPKSKRSCGCGSSFGV